MKTTLPYKGRVREKNLYISLCGGERNERGDGKNEKIFGKEGVRTVYSME